MKPAVKKNRAAEEAFGVLEPSRLRVTGRRFQQSRNDNTKTGAITTVHNCEELISGRQHPKTSPIPFAHLRRWVSISYQDPHEKIKA